MARNIKHAKGNQRQEVGKENEKETVGEKEEPNSLTQNSLEFAFRAIISMEATT